MDETPAPPKSTVEDTSAPPPRPIAVSDSASLPNRAPQSVPQSVPPPTPPEPESDSDDPALPIPPDTICRRRGCGARSSTQTSSSREAEECIYHPGYPLFHEGTKGWTCCKRRVLEFDEFMQMKGCETKSRHMFVGSGKKRKDRNGGEEEKVENVK